MTRRPRRSRRAPKRWTPTSPNSKRRTPLRRTCQNRLRVLGPDDTVGRGAALAAGQYITKDIYIEVITDARGYTATQLEISLTPALSLLSQAGGSGQTNLSVRYRKDY